MNGLMVRLLALETFFNQLVARVQSLEARITALEQQVAQRSSQ